MTSASDFVHDHRLAPSLEFKQDPRKTQKYGLNFGTRAQIIFAQPLHGRLFCLSVAAFLCIFSVLGNTSGRALRQKPQVVWRDGRVVYGGSLENCCGIASHRGFESLSLRCGF